jgi:hypothetical protein
MDKKGLSRVGLLFALALIFVGTIGAAINAGALSIGDSSSKRAISRKRYRLSSETVVVGTNKIGTLTLGGFREGRVVILGAAADLAFALDEDGFSEGDIKLDVAIGSAANTDTNLTDATDKDILQAIAVAAWTNGASHSGVSAAAVLPVDGSSTALNPILNFLTTNTVSTAITGTVSGTVWITYTQIDD